MTKDKIRETLAFEPLTEEEKSKRHILGRLYGPIADIINPTRNGRKYSEQLWENVFNNPIMQEKIKNGVCYGELGHPADREEVDMEKIAIVMPEAPKKDKDGHLIGYFDILDTPNGRILKTLCDYGSKLGISSRGTGDLEEDEYGEESVNPDTYDCECFDVVIVPAVESARLTFTEGLDKGMVKLKKALCEDLNKASEEDKKVMKEALETLNIKLNEEETSEEEVDVEVTSEDDEEVELSFDEKIKQLFALTHGGDEAPKEEEVEMFVQAFKSIFPEECYNPEGCADKESEEETIPSNDEEAIDDGSELIVKNLQEALKDNSELKAQVKSLQEQLAVSDTKVTGLEERLNKDNSTIVRLTKLAKSSKELSEKVSSLEESLKEKDSKINELKESLSKKNLNEELTSEKDSTIKQLNESLNALKDEHSKEIESLRESSTKQLNESTALVESLKTKLAESNKLSEGYKALANNVMNSYIKLRAKNLAVRVSDITEKLQDNYTLEDVDRVCESLKTYNYTASKLPYGVDRNINIKIKESKDRIVPTYENDDDYVDEDLKRFCN